MVVVLWRGRREGHAQGPEHWQGFTGLGFEGIGVPCRACSLVGSLSQEACDVLRPPRFHQLLPVCPFSPCHHCQGPLSLQRPPNPWFALFLSCCFTRKSALRLFISLSCRPQAGVLGWPLRQCGDSRCCLLSVGVGPRRLLLPGGPSCGWGALLSAPVLPSEQRRTAHLSSREH